MPIYKVFKENNKYTENKFCKGNLRPKQISYKSSFSVMCYKGNKFTRETTTLAFSIQHINTFR